MKTAIRMACLGLVSVTVVSVTAFAQQLIGPDAGAKARGEVTSSLTHQRHAQEHTQILYYTMQVNPKAPSPVLHEQAASVKASLVKSNESLKAVKDVHAKDPEVVKLVDSILKHQASAEAECDVVTESIKKGDAAAKISNCCADIHNEIEAAKSEMEKLSKLLKAEPLPIPKKK